MDKHVESVHLQLRDPSTENQARLYRLKHRFHHRIQFRLKLPVSEMGHPRFQGKVRDQIQKPKARKLYTGQKHQAVDRLDPKPSVILTSIQDPIDPFGPLGCKTH